MTTSNLLQTAIYERLVAHAGLTALIDGRVYDDPRTEQVYPHVTFGPSDFVPEDAQCISGRIETQQIDIWSTAVDGKRECKDIVDQVKAALHDYEVVLSGANLVLMVVVLARVMDDPNPAIKHGVVTIEALIEET